MLKSHFNIKGDDAGIPKVPDQEPRKPRLRPGKKLVEPKEDEYEEGHEQIEEEHVEEEKITTLPERKLNKSEISIRLSLLGKTAEGDGYTYLKANCSKMSLTDITAIKSFHHLQFVDVSNNNLTIDKLQVVTELPFLVLIHADRNLLTSAALKKMKYMQVMIMNNNQITSVQDVYQPELSTLEVGYNQITNIYFESKMPQIKCLDFRYNLIEDILELDYPNLDSLYLAGNKISSLEGIGSLINLRVLHLRNNPIKLLHGFVKEMKKLQYVNFRNCKISTLKQIKKLRVLSSLVTLIIKGCPYMGGKGEEVTETTEEEDPELRIEVLAALPGLKRLDKEAVTPEEKNEAKALMKQWIDEGEDEEEIQEENEEEPYVE